jgi:hypothetical protein
LFLATAGHTIVDESTMEISVAKKTGHPNPVEPRPAPVREKVLGIRVSPALARAVKMEAARRGTTVANLFEEFWQTYRSGLREC